jgi:hypothetical protein
LLRAKRQMLSGKIVSQSAVQPTCGLTYSKQAYFG